MRKLIGLLAVLVFGAFAVAALAGPPPHNGDKVSGGGVNNPPICDTDPNSADCKGAMATFNINASFDAKNNPHGTVRFTKHAHPDVQLEGKVTCLVVSGNQATIGVDLTKVKNADTDPDGMFVFVQDNGKPVHGHAVDEERSMNTFGFVPGPNDCPPPQDPGRTITKGNINVKDAP